MKEFNLSAALAGIPVVTRDGQEVKELKIFSTARYPEDVLAGTVEGKIQTWNEKGRFNQYGDSARDLFMVGNKKTGWINIYKGTQNETGRNIWSTKELALANTTTSSLVDTIEITWEE